MSSMISAFINALGFNVFGKPQNRLQPACLLTWSNCLYVSSTEQPKTAPPPAVLASLRAGVGGAVLGCFWYWVFIHVIDRLASCPGAHRQLDLLSDFASKCRQVWNGDGVHLHQAPTVKGFDLKNRPRGINLTRFFVGSAAEGSSSAKDAGECEHDFSL